MKRTRASQKAYKDAQLPTNGVGLVTAAALRAVKEDEYDSMVYPEDEAHVSVDSTVSDSIMIFDFDQVVTKHFKASNALDEAKTIQFINSDNAEHFGFIFEIDSVSDPTSVTLTFDLGSGVLVKMMDVRWTGGTQTWAPVDSGKYVMKGRFDGTDWLVDVSLDRYV